MHRHLLPLACLLSLSAALHAQPTSLPYFEDFEASAGGFISTGINNSWARGTPNGVFIPAAASGSFAWVTNPNGSYNNTETSVLESPTFDFTNLTVDPILQFQHIFETESCCDETWVQLSINGGTFLKLGAANDPGSINWYNDPFNNWWDGISGSPGEWRLARHTLDGAAGNMVKIRWFFSTDTSSVRDGIGVDDVAIFESLMDVGVASIDAPSSGTGVGGAEQIDITVTNQGTTAESNFTISYTVTGPVNSAATETFVGPIGPVTTAPFSFATLADMSVPGTYVVQVTTELVGDENAANNTLAKTVIAQPTITNFPYFEDFDFGDGAFVSAGTDSSWEHGVPTGNFIGSAASGANAWVTNLDGFYTPGELSYVVSPTFDCSGMTNDPFLEFSHLFQIDFSNESWVEVSINGGPFAKLGAANDPGSLNWYNDTFSNWWDGNSGAANAWRKARHIVPGAAGNSLAVRWVMQADTTFSINEDGVGVDDVAIYEAQFGNGQVPQSTALLDINGAMERLGFPVSVGIPGPYFTAPSAASNTFDLHFQGNPFNAIVLLGGSLKVGAFGFAGQQLDLSPYQIWASGLLPTGLNPLFNTNALGVMDLSVTIPLPLIGQVVSFQAILATADTAFVTNVVQVSFLP